MNTMQSRRVQVFLTARQFMQRSGQQHRGRPFRRRGRGRGRAAGDGDDEEQVKPVKSGWNNFHKQVESGSRLSHGSANTWEHSSGDVAFKDAVLPMIQRRISRETVDNQLVQAAKRPWDGRVNKVASLQKLAMRVLAENAHRSDVLDGLSEGLLSGRLLGQLFRRLQHVYAGSMPYFMWERLAHTYADTPRTLKTYTDVVFDDADTLRHLHTFKASFAFTPSCEIVTYLNVSCTAFTKADVHKVKHLLSSSLVALRLDLLPVIDDDALADLSRDCEDGQEFAKLQILSLRGCTKVTDKSASRFAKFHRLKLIDIRGSSCTSATKTILRGRTRPPFVAAFSALHRSLFANMTLDKQARQLEDISRAPFPKADATHIPVLAESMSPALHITKLTRLDNSRIRDPRDARNDSPFVANHHIYGSVYTTMPISKEELHKVGDEAASKGEAFRTGCEAVMRGELVMSQLDRAWQRPLKNDKDDSVDVEVEEVYEDDSDLEQTPSCIGGIEAVRRATPEDNSTGRFYRTSTAPAIPSVAASIPEKDDLMLLRFFGSISEANDKAGLDAAHSERIQQVVVKHLLPSEGSALEVKKRKSDKVSNDLFSDLLVKPIRKRLAAAADANAIQSTPALAPRPSSQTSVASIVSNKGRPLGIVKKRFQSTV